AMLRLKQAREVPPSELLAHSPGLDVGFRLPMRTAAAILDEGDQLDLAAGRGSIEIGEEGPELLGFLHVSPLARDGCGALAALETEHWLSPSGCRWTSTALQAAPRFHAECRFHSGEARVARHREVKRPAAKALMVGV